MTFSNNTASHAEAPFFGPPIDIATAFEHEPPQLDFIWPGFLAGTVGALVAPGAAGKSYWTMEAAMSVACSVAGADLVDLSPKCYGRVVYFAGEDPEPAINRRLYSMGRHLPPLARDGIAQNLIIEPIMGKRLNLMNDLHLDKVINYCASCRLIILDTLSRVHTLDENSNGDMARLIGTLEYIGTMTGAAVLFLHHVAKGSVREGQIDQQHAARGASALIDNARWCGYLSKMTDVEAAKFTDQTNKKPIGSERKGFLLRFGISKQNYDVAYQDKWYERRDGGVLIPIHLEEARTCGERGRRRDEI